MYASGAVTDWSMATNTMPRFLASAITGLSAAASAGLATIAFAPAEIRLRIAAICSGAPPFWFWTTTLLILPLASAWALAEQIISSRKPLPTSVLLTPSTYFLLASPPLWPLDPELLLSSPLPQPTATTAIIAAVPSARHVVPHFLTSRILLSSYSSFAPSFPPGPPVLLSFRRRTRAPRPAPCTTATG